MWKPKGYIDVVDSGCAWSNDGKMLRISCWRSGKNIMMKYQMSCDREGLTAALVPNVLYPEGSGKPCAVIEAL